MPSVKHDLSVVLGYIRSLLKPAPKTPHASLASSGMPKALWHCSHFLWPLRLKWLPKPQLRKCDVEQGEETTLTQIEICCLLGLKKKSVLDSSWIRPVCLGCHQHGKNENFWKSSWLRKKIVSHLPGFKTTLQKTNRDVCSGEPLSFKGRSNQTASNHDVNFRWVTLIWYVPTLASAPSLAQHLVYGKNAWTGSWAQLLLIGSDDGTHFLQLAGDPWSLSSYQETLQRDEIPPPNSAKSCIFEGTTAIDCQQIKAESQGTCTVVKSFNWRSNPTCCWLETMGANGAWWQ